MLIEPQIVWLISFANVMNIWQLLVFLSKKSIILSLAIWKLKDNGASSANRRSAVVFF